MQEGINFLNNMADAKYLFIKNEHAKEPGNKSNSSKYLKEDDYLNVSEDTCNIIYHPNLNVILLFTKSGDVKVLDVNSGLILHSCSLFGEYCLGWD